MLISVSNGEKPRIIRKLGPFERFQNALYVLDFYCGTSITCRYSIPQHLREPVARSRLRDLVELAVAATISQHPLLQVGLVDEDTKKPAWVQLDHIDLSQHIEWTIVESKSDYEEVYKKTISRQLDTKFVNLATRPGWRLAVLNLEHEGLLEIIFVWNHANTDGVGGKIFHETLLEALCTLTNGPEMPALDNHICNSTASVETMVPPQNVIAKYRITPRYAAAHIWKELRPPVLASDPSFASWGPITPTPRETQMRSLTIDNSLLQKVLSSCRSHKTTLTACLNGIAFVSLAPQLAEEKVGSMVGATPLDLRRFIKTGPPDYPWLEPNRMIGNYVTRLRHEFGRDLVEKVRGLAQNATEQGRFGALEEEMWAAAITIRGELQDRLDLGLKNDTVGLMGAVGDWKKYHIDISRKPRVSSWMVTNVGVINGQPKADHHGWSIQGGSFALSANIVSAMFTLSTITVKDRGLCIVVSCQDHIVDASVGERLVADVEGWLNYIGSNKA
ncbi:alcohol acetyltransferase-domain-containing protein [Mariannaea sp. PMI_226]|nr:alcohol acetyltransferase-domain-containing protein [Mariannaea sp. PMI_226]